MADHKAKVVISQEVWKKIKWFTYNFDTEIGGYGRVKLRQKDGEKYFYVDKLFFPQQEVSGATVKVEPEGWLPLIKEHGMAGLGDINFYWHRHPGNSSHSGTDDEHTFETLMSKEANRKFYIFLQTAVGGQGWNHEARIDLRLPVRTTILNNQIEIVVEKSPEEEELKKECEAIAEKCIIKPKPMETIYATDTATSFHNQKTFEQFRYEEKQKNQKLILPAGMSIEDVIKDGRYGNIEGTDHYDNDILDGFATTEDEKVMITFENGQATIVAGKKYGEILENVLTKKKDGKLSKFVRTWKKDKNKTSTKTTYNIQPIAKKYLEMKTSLVRSYLVFCDALLKEMSKTEETNNVSTENDLNQQFTTIEGKEICKELLIEMEYCCIVMWENVYNAIAYAFDSGDKLGTININHNEDKLIISGHYLIPIVNAIQEQISEEE